MTCQAGGAAIDHYANDSFLVVREGTGDDTVLQVADVGLSSTPDDRQIGPLAPPGTPSMWILNLAPVVPWLPYPRPIDARFSMEGLTLTIKWPSYTYAGIRPIDLDGDTVPETIDVATRQLGPRSCYDMLAER